MIAITPGLGAPQTSAVLQLAHAAYCDLGGALPVSFQGVAPYTFEGWFWFDGLCPNASLLTKAGEFSFGTQGAMVVVSRTGQLFPLQTGDVLDTKRWIHLATTFDGDTLSIYVDGLRQASTSTPGPGVPSQGQYFQLGATFQGQIDSFRVWNICRTQSQVYENQWVTVGAQTGLIAEYDCTQVPPVDTSGNGNPITLRAGAQSLQLTPAVDVGNNGYCEPVDDAMLVNPGGDPTAPFSIVAWINLEYIESYPQCIFANGDWAAQNAAGVFLTVDPSGSCSALFGSSAATSQAVLGVNQWYCIACTFDGTTLQLYVNGVPDGTATGAPTGKLSQGDLTIAAAFNSGSSIASNTLQGRIQFVSVWSTCLAPGDLEKWMYHNPTDQPGLTADYSFTDDSATNLQTTNPIGLAAGAKLTVIETGVLPTVELTPRPRAAARGAGPALTDDDLRERAAFYTSERRRLLIDEYRRALPALGPRRERAADLAAFTQMLDAMAAGDAAAHPRRRVRFRAVVDGDWLSLREVTEKGEVEVARRSTVGLTPCQTAEISFLIATFDLFLGLFGLVCDTSVAERFFSIRIGQEAGAFATALQAILALPLTASSVLKVIALLWDFGWFTSLAQAALNGMSWWDWFTLAARVASMVVPWPSYQKAYAVAQIVIGLWEVATAFNQVETACYGPPVLTITA